MSIISMKKFQRMYGVSVRKERTGFLRYNVSVTCNGRELYFSDVRSVFGPSLGSLLHPTVEQARTADVFQESFDLYMEPLHDSLRTEAWKDWAPCVEALSLLRNVFGPYATEDLLWRVSLP